MGSFSVFFAAALAGLSLAQALECDAGDTMCKTTGWTIPMADFDPWTHMADCGMTMAGCTGELTDRSTHGINGTIVVKDDCTFAVHGWQFDGLGPAVEWWVAAQDEDPLAFPYPANAIKVAKLGEVGAYPVGSENGGDSDIIVRLGQDSDGVQKTLSAEFSHISVWCEEFKIDFGNAALVCPPPEV